MKKTFLKHGGCVMPVYSAETVIVGSGAAALNAALCCHAKTDTVVVTEGMNMGTSRNTGSDKQTYYKLSTGLTTPDCAADMAQDYLRGGSMHGDLALVEAAGSLGGFFKLVSLGVPFPHDRYGEYTGYRTDHDARMRAASCGPLTSKYMTEALESACRTAGVRFFDGYRAVRVLTEDSTAAGILCISENEITDENPAGLAVFLSGATVWAVGGPSAVYYGSVYPESQNCSLGAPMAAGVTASNLTESQYGIASVKFRWNLSGSYQQVLPRYVSVDPDGTEHEFLADFHPHLIFSKGYEWPFDPDKITSNSGSSRVDLAVYGEIQRGRRVYLDFMRDPVQLSSGITEESVGQTAYDYLRSSDSLGDTPVKRLRQMNERAYRLYLDHGIDLEREYLEIQVSAQHLNGGLECGIWYENPVIRNFYPVGECAGVFGVKRPGGSALNSTQVSSSRASERICALKVQATDKIPGDALAFAQKLTSLLRPGGKTVGEILREREENGRLHDACAAFLRKPDEIGALLAKTRQDIDGFFTAQSADSHRALVQLAISYDVLLTRYAMLSAISHYIADGGKSRGSYLITDGKIPETVETDTVHRDCVLVTSLELSGDSVSSSSTFVPARPIPTADNWFETVYNTFGKPELYE
ncbi:MAG: FAD-binding protein [Clostridia bacterium]|nr:FAD-binding protein [Clostridia bacterium]